MTSETSRPEIWFYHLQRFPLERVLPKLLEKTLERGWRAVVRVGNHERLAALDTHLWTYDPAGFLPHGTANDGHAARQPIFLTEDSTNPNRADACFLVDGARLEKLDGYARVFVIFDGNDEEARLAARGDWRSAREQGYEVTYWQQSAEGRWEQKASAGASRK